MPKQPSWFQRVPEIVDVLEAPACPPFLDRAAIERLFHLRRRQAIRLMSSCSGFHAGRSFLVDRNHLLQFLHAHHRRDEIDSSVARRHRILDLLAQAQRQSRARRLSVPLSPAATRCELAALPAGISLEPRRLEVHFAGALDLLEKLVTLSQVLSQDFENFERFVE